MKADFYKNRNLFFWLAGAGTIILFFLLMSFMLNKLIHTSEQLMLAQKDFAVLESKRLSLEEFRREGKELRLQLGQINQVLVKVDVPIDPVRFLETLAKQTGLDIDISSVAVSKDKKGTGETLDFQISITGFPSDFLLFLAKLEKAPYLIEITSLQISGERREAKAGLEEKLPPPNAIKADLFFKIHAE